MLVARRHQRVVPDAAHVLRLKSKPVALPSSKAAGGANAITWPAETGGAQLLECAHRHRLHAAGGARALGDQSFIVVKPMRQVLGEADEAEAGGREDAGDVLLLVDQEVVALAPITFSVCSAVAPVGIWTWVNRKPWSSSGRKPPGSVMNISTISPTITAKPASVPVQRRPAHSTPSP